MSIAQKMQILSRKIDSWLKSLDKEDGEIGLGGRTGRKDSEEGEREEESDGGK